jgi:hypothetical protein
MKNDKITPTDSRKSESKECSYMLNNYNTDEPRCVKVERTDNFTSKYRVIRVIRINLN